jgi:glutamate-ammonia-ligase adenylyltransferase
MPEAEARADRIDALLGDPEAARLRLAKLGVRDIDRGLRDLRDIAARGGSEELLDSLLTQLDQLLPQCPDAGMALTNLERFIAASRDPATALAGLRRSPRMTEALLQLFSTSHYFSELIIRDPSVMEWLRSGAERRDRDGLFELLWARIQAEPDEDAQRLEIRRFRHRQMLRIGYNDIVRGLPLEIITQDLSNLAEACVEAACRIARGRAVARHGEARGPDGRPLRFVVLALGKLGGAELNYSSDIDLIFLYESEGQTSGPRVVSNAEFFARMGGEVIRLLSDHTPLGQAYRVDMRLRPEGDQGPLARSLASTVGYYETAGRTWERQALIKCRPIAGDLVLGREFLSAIAPFVYRRYLGAAEIGEIKAMKRRIEARTHSAGGDEVEVKTGHGGIRDVEFVVQFLQLLHGGADPSVRHPNTLVAIERLEYVRCLAPEERGVMEDTYRFLRKVEHRLQTMFDRQTHRMPVDPEERRTLAIRLGYPPASAWEDRTGPAQRFLADYRSKTDLNRRILNHLLHDAFSDDKGQDADPVVDLVLDPEPSPELREEVLGRYPFRDRDLAYRNLMALAREDFEFLSQPRCRHFLAAIAPPLLKAVAATPDPDQTLTNLEKVSASLGAKAILWELFSLNPPSLRLYVELCSTSQLLSEILITNPGMIDDLIDSLVVDRPQPASAIRGELAELCRRAEDLAPILLSFRNKEWLRIGARDILGREPIRDVTRELADVAEAILGQVARTLWDSQVQRSGAPRRASDDRRARWAILGLGKVGGREMTYHSDLDLVFLYDGDGLSEPRDGAKAVPNAEFFADLARRVIRALEGQACSGMLYKVDTRLRPYGSSGPLAVSLDAFRAYFGERAQPWEWLALTRARVLFSQGTFGRDVTRVVREILAQPVDPDALAGQVAAMRAKLVESRGPNDLKRSPGGLVDIEFLVQYLSLVHASNEPDVLRPNTWDALDALRRHGRLSAADQTSLRHAYEFRREVEARLRIIHNRTDVALPEDADSLARLARRLNFEAGEPAAAAEEFRSVMARHAAATRALFDQIISQRAGSLPRQVVTKEGARR